MKKPNTDFAVLNSIASRAHYLATQMIHEANHREGKKKGDPKVGGHPASSASALHILGALHLVVKTGFDHMAVKPHASPTDHAYNYLLDLLLDENNSRLSPELAEKAMHGLRAFAENGEPVFQSYHSHYDPDHHNFLPSGTVGIPPVNLGYLAHAYRYAKEHGYQVPPNAHFWAVVGDSEFREGSLYEAIPDFAERELGNLTWIVDYNRQSLDGHRITNRKIMGGTDGQRIERTAIANGWNVISLPHGSFRLSLFEKKGGEVFKKFLEEELEDFEFQALLLNPDLKAVRQSLLKSQPALATILKSLSDEELSRALRDMGGHDLSVLVEALNHCRKPTNKPTMVIAHTIKGWGLKVAAVAGNHSALPSEEELASLRKAQGLNSGLLFARFAQNSVEAQFLRSRGESLYADMQAQWRLRDENKKFFAEEISSHGQMPDSFHINTKLVSYPHTQWMLGQITAKLTRIANASSSSGAQKPLTGEENALKVPGELLVSMAPDVGTSTNLNPAMDGKVFGAQDVYDLEAEFNVKDAKNPDLVPGEDKSDRFLRFEIAEGNVMSCVGSYGRIRDLLGIPLIPLMTVYDFFIKRALDQLFYNYYWKSSFILLGTPAGVTLSSEGAQHGWKSDFQIPNQITWEPCFCQEMDWILADSIRRHLTDDNQGRTGVLIRGSTRGIDQNLLAQRTRRQVKFKQNLFGSNENESSQSKPCLASHPIEGAIDESTLAAMPDDQILQTIRQDVLQGGYYLIDYRGYAGYDPGDNVINLVTMGSLVTEAVEASDQLLNKGIYANVLVVTSPDLLLGNLGHENGYYHLKQTLGLQAHLHLTSSREPESGSHNGTSANSRFNTSTRLSGDPTSDLITLAGRRVPIVSVHDGEPGLLDNLGSIIGVRQESLSVRKHSKCGRPDQIYPYHHIDGDSVVKAVMRILEETAEEKIEISQETFGKVSTGLSSAKSDRPAWM